ncbi:DUF6231 family protein [Gammaproteobacteria bacterium]|nr:DUF6231 family protein [Gammaproteobacteria bacterium]
MQKDKIQNNFLLDILKNESCLSAQLVTSKDVSKLIKKIEKAGLNSINIAPNIKEMVECTDDIFIVLEDVPLSESDVGTIKNLLSQKIIIFTPFDDSGNAENSMTRLGFVLEVNDVKNDLKCFSYNLKTYNNKRSWNNAEGWANPENFDKFRW